MPFRQFPRILLVVCIALAAGFADFTHAQELQSQAAPFTVWLDFKALADPNGPRVALPIWVESVQVTAPENNSSDANAKKTIYRIRLRNFPGLNDEILLRVYFTDQSGSQPVVTGWTELGNQVGAAKPLGSGIGLATSETLVLSTKGVDYFDIEVPGDGTLVRGALLASLKNASTKEVVDFDPPTSPLSDPFQAAAPASPGKNDTLLFGRVKATLDSSAVKLSGTDSNLCSYEFELAHQPLVAVLSFELLNADPSNPPSISMNNVPLGGVSLSLPDLADPAYRGTIRPLQSDMQFHYNGWIKCQKIIPGSSLTSGSNKAVIQTGTDSTGFAIRAVEIQLKYNAKTMDYDLKP